ncbi:MAG: CPBP family intramembrane metalloprotease [bacterium]|nr:CPBP family intramembrane metalloprotease [bacterium]
MDWPFEKNGGLFINPFVFAAGMILFALCAHQEDLFLPRVCGACLSTIALTYGIAKNKNLPRLFGFTGFPKYRLWYIILSLLLGAALAVYFRSAQEIALVPQGFRAFCILAAVIGICEELVYRGFLQGSLKKYGPWTAVFLASLFHSLYKTGLFIFPDVPERAHLIALGLFTFFVGALLGLMREHFGSIIFPLISHAVFDVIAYGDMGSVPWWVL